VINTNHQSLCRSTAILALAALLLLGGCSAPPKRMQIETSEAGHFWPGPPEIPRFRYVGQLTGEANFPADPDATSGARKFLGWIAGIFSGSPEPRVLQRPQSGMVDEAGRIYVTDVSRPGIYLFDTVARELHIWEFADRYSRFIAPIGITLGGNNEILVTDAELGEVFRLARDGKPLGSFGDKLLKRPTGIAYNPESGLIYVADVQAHDIKVFNNTFELVETLGARGTQVGEFNFPTHLAFADGQLYVTDSMNARVQIYTANGDFKHAFGERGINVGDLPHPKGVTIDSDGNIYVIESYYDHLLVYNQQGTLLLPIGGTGKGIGEFYLPAGLWHDNNDQIYIADMYNGRVVILQYLGDE